MVVKGLRREDVGDGVKWERKRGDLWWGDW